MRIYVRIWFLRLFIRLDQAQFWGVLTLVFAALVMSYGVK